MVAAVRRGPGVSSRYVIAALVVAGLVLGLFLWRQQQRVEAAERQVAQDSARVLSLTFKDARSLVVRRAQGKLVANRTDPGFAGLLRSSQTTVVPFTFAYSVDLSRVSAGAYRWHEESRTMFVEVPDITIEQPNVDMAKAVTTQDGLFISRGAGVRLAKAVAVSAAERAAQEANKPEQLEAARQSARKAVSAMTRAPLLAAGLGEVRVEVRFPLDGRRSDEQWDESVPVQTVLGLR